MTELDLASFDSIEKFAHEIRTKHPKFDCLINNAGMATQQNEATKDNFEIHFGVNHLGHYLLVDLLKDVIKENEARVVVVASLMHKRGRIDFETMAKPRNSPLSTRMNPLYNDSKLMNVYFARELYKRGFDVHVLCPGLCHTDFFRSYNPKWYHYIVFAPIAWLFLRSAEQVNWIFLHIDIRGSAVCVCVCVSNCDFVSFKGAQNIVHCATDNENTETKNPFTGYLIVNLKQYKSPVNFEDSVSEQLWEESAKLCSLAH